MALERTLSIIKPDAVEKHKAGAILGRLESEGFVVKAMKRIHLTRTEAEGFYAEHKGRGFFDELCTFMSRSPIIVMALEREDAVASRRACLRYTSSLVGHVRYAPSPLGSCAGAASSSRVGPRGTSAATPARRAACATTVSTVRCSGLSLPGGMSPGRYTSSVVVGRSGRT